MISQSTLSSAVFCSCLSSVNELSRCRFTSRTSDSIFFFYVSHHNANSTWQKSEPNMCAGIVVCLCSQHALGFTMPFFFKCVDGLRRVSQPRPATQSRCCLVWSNQYWGIITWAVAFWDYLKNLAKMVIVEIEFCGGGFPRWRRASANDRQTGWDPHQGRSSGEFCVSTQLRLLCGLAWIPVVSWADLKCRMSRNGLYGEGAQVGAPSSLSWCACAGSCNERGVYWTAVLGTSACRFIHSTGILDVPVHICDTITAGCARTLSVCAQFVHLRWGTRVVRFNMSLVENLSLGVGGYF